MGLIKITAHVINRATSTVVVKYTSDVQNRRLALKRLIQQAISVERRRELDLYKRYASDPDFKRAFDASVSRLLSSAACKTLVARA
ncbi:hypothetical protein M6I34_08245 [Burkholderiaceae bacterium FT117]|uniref:hypothetical protein n=1 Tax=Zeimonas sediminis TaxID=2944268 RepID=UPI0023431852|nr:hypothetical protein [Zeimonas sediminis]MCM5570496.1 hypothetical protein [Zeimonas sediminis]